MKIKHVFIPVLLLAAVFARPITGTAEGVIISVTQDASSVEQYTQFEASIILSTPFNDPTDPEKVDLSAEIVTPSGKKVTMPAFYTGADTFWKIRYTPLETGNYTYTLILKTPSDSCSSDSCTFSSVPGNNAGFVRRSENNSFYLRFDSGRPFFGIGYNVGWVTNNDINIYDKYFSEFERNGLNLVRIWLNSPWTLEIEPSRTGAYEFQDCAKLDQLLSMAGKRGIYVIVTMDSYGTLMSERGDWNEGSWSANPYNKRNGGPCDEPWDFFTDRAARKLYKNRLRYMIARFSSYPNVLAFEFWNETDVPEDWAREMSAYMKNANPHGQLLTLSLGYPWGNNFDENDIWTVKDLDIVQRHIYGNLEKDLIGNIISVNRSFAALYAKPVMIGEFGMHAGRDDKEIDSPGNGTALHNSLWASVMSGSMSTAMNWWWQSYVRPKNMYPHYAAIGKFLRGTDWDSGNIRFVNVSSVTLDTGSGADAPYSNVRIPTKEAWGDTRFGEFTVDNNGNVSGGLLNHYLQGERNEKIRLSPVFHLDYPADGKFNVNVGIVSQGAELVVMVDGKEAAREEFPVGPDKGQRCLFRKDLDIYQCVYNSTVFVDIPKGKHTVKLVNIGNDWIGIKSIELVNYSGSRFADTRQAAIGVGDTILMWIQNKSYNWKNARNGIAPSVVKGARAEIEDVRNGNYTVEWWDTFTGNMVSKHGAAGEDGRIRLDIPEFDRDIACKIIYNGS